ncbi:MAG TPA: 5-(carboxyamino)imidazole ribonucleotide mutase [Pyrinomonadaceae bacterium]|nr:5-(carboxyamino)imidazole ribonucleotide mutase [Pyrinomonadaceae bacterium]
MTTKKKGTQKSNASRRVPASPRPRVTASPRLPLSASPRPRASSGPLVAVIMGSKSDWETMRHADQTLKDFGVAHECKVMSAHRTPHLASDFAATAESRGLEIIIAAAGGAAHLAGVLAAHTTLPILGVPMKSDALNGMDSLLATVQMPAGIPVGTLAIGKAGAINAALLAIAILANQRPDLRKQLQQFRARQAEQVRAATLD